MTTTPADNRDHRPPGRIGYAAIAGFILLALILVTLVVLNNT